MGKKIAFISPKSAFYFNNESKNSRLKSLPGFGIYVNFWTGIGTALPILASLTSDEYESIIIDENIEDINFDADYDLVCITAMTHQAIRAYRIASEFKKKKIYTVIGGIHIFTMYEEALNFCDTAIVGEAESAWTHFLEDLKKGIPKKIYFQKDYGEVDIKNLPIPRYDLLKDKGYSTIWINTSRGCPYDCEFCSVTNLFGKKYRHKSVEQIVKEIEYVKKVFNKIYVGFGDDNMFVDRDFSNRLMEKFGELNFRWVCQSDISIGKDIDFLKKLYKAGCHVIFIGFESLNEQNLSNIYEKTKKLKRDYYSQYSEMIANIQESGLGILGSFIIGLDNDTKESIEGIADFVEKTNMLTATLNVLTPLPGTRLRKRLENENRIIPTSWENYTFWDINFIPRALTYRELDERMIKTLERIYSLERTKKVTDYYKEIYKNLMENETL